MEEIWNFLSELVNPESIIRYGGFWLLLFVIFAETGLFVGFFLPGDSLLFTAGLLTATGVLDVPVFFVALGIAVSATIGNITGFAFGRKVGDMLFKKERTTFFKPEHLILAKEYYDKHGALALVLGRFLPIIRTFAPIVAGIVKMNYYRFFILSVVGGFIWAFSLVYIGYYLGITIPWIKDYLGYIVVFLIIITTVPIILKLRKEKIKK